MKYIVFKTNYNIYFGNSNIERVELNSDKELKEYLFDNRDSLDKIEIFNKNDKVEIKIDINISKE